MGFFYVLFWEEASRQTLKSLHCKLVGSITKCCASKSRFILLYEFSLRISELKQITSPDDSSRQLLQWVAAEPSSGRVYFK